VASDDGKGDDLDTAPADAEVAVDGAYLTPAQRTAIKIRATKSMEKGAKYGVPEESAEAMIASIEASGYPAIATRNARRNAFLTIILEKGIELRNRMPAGMAPPEFDDSIGARNMARFRNFLESLDPGSRGARAVADVISSIDRAIIAEQTKATLVYLMRLINELPRRTPAAAQPVTQDIHPPPAESSYLLMLMLVRISTRPNKRNDSTSRLEGGSFPTVRSCRGIV
jgi:hypothetical protein